MAQDPEYAALTKARKAESTRKHTAKRKAALDDLKERAKTDPQAAEELEAIRAKGRAAGRKSYAKKKAEAAEDRNFTRRSGQNGRFMKKRRRPQEPNLSRLPRQIRKRLRSLPLQKTFRQT